MSIFNLFKRQKETPANSILQANTTLYPDKILIETTDRVKEGFGISSSNITILPLNTDTEVLGSVVRHHLSLTKAGLPIPEDYKQHYNDFLKKAGFKNGKAHHRNALLLNIDQQENEIKITPTRNGGYTGKNRGFLEIKDICITVKADTDNAVLGDKIKHGWTMCEYNCI
jgi:hypothetical protein